MIRVYETTEGLDLETLKMLGEAMDAAWQRAEFVYVEGKVSSGRIILAEYILALAEQRRAGPRPAHQRRVAAAHAMS